MQAEKGQLKLALTTALEQKASTSGALAEAEGRLQEATQQVCGMPQSLPSTWQAITCWSAPAWQ